MIKKGIMLFLLTSAICLSQTGKDYFPAVEGEAWYYRSTVLDSLQQPIDSIAGGSCSIFAGPSPISNRQSYTMLSRTGNLTDTTYISVTDTIIYRLVRPGSFFMGLPLPPYIMSGIGGALGGWCPYLQFKARTNIPYTLYEFDTTIIVDSTLSLPLRVKIAGTKRSLRTLTVPAGTFVTQPFDITTSISVIMSPLAIPILSLTDTISLAAGHWVVKEVQLTSQFPYITIPTIPIPSVKIPGFQKVLLSYTTGVPAVETGAIPVIPRLAQNFPNPFNPETEIRYSIASAEWVRLSVFDPLGREIALLTNGIIPPGEHSVRWNAETCASGIYYYRLQTSGYSVTKRMVVLR